MRNVQDIALVMGGAVTWHVCPCVLQAPYHGAPRESSLRPAMNRFRSFLTQWVDVAASGSLVTHVPTFHLLLPLGDLWNITVSKLY